MTISLTDDGMCFCCGQNNPIGLKLAFAWEGDDYVTYFTPGAVHQSYAGITHGGIVSTVLDEVMGRIMSSRGIPAVTARMEVRFRHAVPTGERVRFAARIVRERGKVIDASATAVLADGRIAAEATGRFLVHAAPASSEETAM
ncbi:thioesterase family protein, putative [Heliomicrobium modesticaldum Ice1]|uniref:Acyl-coenzyme A thioesterase THEM4 n=1 Tax=Heliobacterium modesticaldum (strain ATCC 51547 / Ice1) TaxID=498761 RepID=B0TGJ6_HELMI|nr:PaaI family thioesterase [Heliomicrobium modesticaldum]ABZ83257.1 thioesterase family protein, putative [Heliomicrobium modesticaldum Ice1]